MKYASVLGIPGKLRSLTSGPRSRQGSRQLLVELSDRFVLDQDHQVVAAAQLSISARDQGLLPALDRDH